MHHEIESTALWSIGTAVPTFQFSQQKALTYALSRIPPAIARHVKFLYRRSQIDSRHTCSQALYNAIELDTGEAAGDEASTAERMQAYESQAADLAARAAKRALAQAPHFSAADITHLVMVTCTGFVSPGPDVLLFEQLGLRSDVRRVQVGFMGCHGAMNGLHTAAAICRSEPQAVVVVASLELCTLHFQSTLTEENLVITSLFSDGAAAALLSGKAFTDGQPRCYLDAFGSRVYPEARDAIAWRVGNQGFDMGLALSNAHDLRPLIPDFVGDWLSSYELHQDDIDLWAIHPGGRAVLDTCEWALGFAPDALASSRWVLRHYGNMSSPTILFVMDHLLAKTKANRVRRGLSLGFGPGVTLEGILWHEGD
uniref:Chalcone synthase n=1 Tax=Candidatus Entotheonella serta TaxID=1652106 RepID=A0A0K0PDI5_9BACT|nr:chalcone synthase [Candidatus Entotheonella serta]